ncbi:MAG: MFS transporter, partial [Syntrophomonas sp.]
NWHYIFYVYFLAIPVLLMVITFIEGKAPANEVVRGKATAVPKELIPWALAAFLVMLTFFGVVTNLSQLIYSRDIGGSQLAGYVFALNSLCMLISGALFLTVQTKLKKFYPSFMLFMMASGYAGLMLAGSLPLLVISVVLSGLGTGLAFPFIMNQASRYAREDNSIVIMGIVSSSAFLGQFSSPLILDNIPHITGNPISNIFAALALSAAFVLIVSLMRSISKPEPQSLKQDDGTRY